MFLSFVFVVELRQSGLVLIHSRQDNRVMLRVVMAVGVILPSLLILIGKDKNLLFNSYYRLSTHCFYSQVYSIARSNQYSSFSKNRRA